MLLPKRFFPEKLCREAPLAGSHFEFVVLLQDLKELPPEIKNQLDTQVHVSLTFSVDDQDFCCIEGELIVNLQMICQRCLSPMIVPIREPIKVIPVTSSSQDKTLPVGYEPLLVIDGEVILNDWIAEELNLALPLVPKHESDCIDSSELKESEHADEPNSLQDALLKLKDMK